MMIVRFKSRLIQVFEDIHQMKKLSQLVHYIPFSFLSRIAFLLLFLWVIAPSIFWIFGWGFPAAGFVESTMKQFWLYEEWFKLLLRIGYIGCIFSIILFIKSILEIREKRTPFIRFFADHALPIFLALMLFWSMISTALSNNQVLSLFGDEYRREGLLTYIAYAGIFTCGLLVRDIKKIRQLLITFILASLVTSIPYIISWIRFFYGIKPLEYPTTLFQINHHGYYLCLASMACLVLFMTEAHSHWFAILWGTTYTITLAALILNKSMGPYLAVIGGLVLTTVFFTMRDSKTFRWRLLIAIGLFLLLSVALNQANNFLGSDFAQITKDAFNIASGSEEAALAGSGRWVLWLNGVQFAWMKPWFGHGPENLLELYRQYSQTDIDRPHNELIQFAASLGIPAMLFYILGLVIHLRNFLRTWKTVDLQVIGVFAIIGAYLISSFFGNSMFYTTPFFMMMLGLSYGMLRSNRE